MIRCLLFGHKPNPMFEWGRHGVHRLTFCERCGGGMTHVVRVGFPVPDGVKTTEEWQQAAAERIATEVVRRLGCMTASTIKAVPASTSLGKAAVTKRRRTRSPK